MRKELLFLSVATLMLTSLFAQDKKETKLYNTTINKGDLKSFNKFLSKYPNSTYSSDITKRVDSLSFFALDKKNIEALNSFVEQYPSSYYTPKANEYIKELNTTKLNHSDAIRVSESIIGVINNPKNPNFILKEYKKDGVEQIVVFIAPSGSSFSSYRVLKLAHNGGSDLLNSNNWGVVEEHTESNYNSNPELNNFSFIVDTTSLTTTKIIEIKGCRYVKFDYKNENNSNEIEYITNLYSVDDNVIYTAMFSGKKEHENGESFLEGNCMDASQGGALSTPQMSYLIGFFGNKEYFRPFSKDKLMIDTAIEWWYDNNKATAKTLAFGVIPSDNPIVTAFKAAKYKEKDSRWDVAVFDIRENTVVVSYDRVERQYSLVWCEPAAKDKKRDQLLNSIYFERNAALVLYYYKGNTTYKKRVNLASKALK